MCIPPASEATNLLPYDKLAEELTQRGLGNAQFVTLSPRDAGNLAVALPEARALSLSARIEPPPPDPIPDRPCAALVGRRVFRAARAIPASQSLSCRIC